MIVERYEGEPSPFEVESRFDSPRELEIAASEVLLEFVREVGNVSGTLDPVDDFDTPRRHYIRATNASDVSEDLKLGTWDDSDNCIVRGVEIDIGLETIVFNLTKKDGVQSRRELPSDGTVSDPKYFPYKEDQFFQSFGDLLLEEIFEPGKKPELSELAERSKAILIDPEDLPLTKLARHRPELVGASALLDSLTVQHVTSLLDIYQSIAYPLGSGHQDWGFGLADGSNEPLLALHNEIKNGNVLGQIELKSGAMCGQDISQIFRKLRRHPTHKMENLLETRMCVGEYVWIGRMDFLFNTDLELIAGYRARVTDFFKAEGILAQT